MKNLVIALLFLLGATLSGKPKKPGKLNYKKIEENIKDKSSKLYYSKLMLRYNSSDTSMTLEEKRHLYYGYVFNPLYAPYSQKPYMDSAYNCMDIDDKDDADYQKVLKFCDSALIFNPFDLKAINCKLTVFKETENSISFDNEIIKAKIFLDAIFSSGDGLSKKTAYHVLYIKHEYNILSMAGYKFGGKQSLRRDKKNLYDYLFIQANEEGIEGLYFNVDRLFLSVNKIMKNN
jgi:hypothetical protein